MVKALGTAPARIPATSERLRHNSPPEGAYTREEAARGRDARRQAVQERASQAVRLPEEFRFEGDEVFITRNEHTGDVTLSDRRPYNTWAEFFARLRDIDVPEEFMADRPMNSIPEDRGVFDDYIEDDSE